MPESSAHGVASTFHNRLTKIPHWFHNGFCMSFAWVLHYETVKYNVKSAIIFSMTVDREKLRFFFKEQKKTTSSSFLYELHRYTVMKNIMALFTIVFDSPITG